MSCLTHIYLLIIVLLHTSATKIENRVLGGEAFDADKHGYLVNINMFYLPFVIRAGFCSGSIISYRWIITAGHCFPKYVNFASIYQQRSSNLIAFSMHIEVHPDFIQGVLSYSNMEKDLALLRTISHMNLNYITTWPIALPNGLVSFGSLATIAGYGDTEPGLQAPREGLVNISECELSRGESVLCSYNDVTADKGDSGGPLIYKGALVGVMSASVTITVRGTVYTNVYCNLNWITNVLEMFD